jgi:hypothetical protein
MLFLKSLKNLCKSVDKYIILTNKSNLLSIKVSDSELKYCGERDPEEIRDVYEGYPFHIWINSE